MWKADARANNMTISKFFGGILTLSGFHLVLLYRFSRWLYQKRVKGVPAFLLKMLGKVLFGADISPNARIGPGLQIVHSLGIVIGSNVEIGKNCRLHQNVTIGANNKTINNRKVPIIEDNVTIYGGAVIIGPITIERGSVIGANAVVTKDVYANETIAPPLSVVIEKN